MKVKLQFKDSALRPMPLDLFEDTHELRPKTSDIKWVNLSMGSERLDQSSGVKKVEPTIYNTGPKKPKKARIKLFHPTDQVALIL